jgi:hypothetical protein
LKERLELPKKYDETDEHPSPKFKIVDRRRAEDENEEPVRAAQPEIPKEPAPAPPDLHTDGAVEQEIPSDGQPETEHEISEDPLGFRNVTLSFLQTLSTISWVHLGLIPHPQTQLIAKKMEEARKTIALFELIYSQVKSELPPEANAEIVGLIRDLKANYVSQL